MSALAEQQAELQPVFRALADPTRRGILTLLSDRDMTIAEVSEQFDMTRAAVKKHLTILQEGRLISVQAHGRTRVNHLEPMVLKDLSDWINEFSHFWDDRLAALQEAVAAEEDKRKEQDQ